MTVAAPENVQALLDHDAVVVEGLVREIAADAGTWDHKIAFDVSEIQKGLKAEGKPDAEVGRIFGRFVIVALNNYLLDTYRHSRRNWTMHGKSLDAREDVGNAGERVADGRNYPNEPGGLDEREMFGALRAALSEEQTKVAYLLYEGRSWKEIGEIMGDTQGSIRDRLMRRAAPALRAILGRWNS